MQMHCLSSTASLKLTLSKRKPKLKRKRNERSSDTDAIKSQSSNKQLNNYFRTVVQIKLLTTLPEMIWSHIDNERFYLATELFIFSRYISTGVQLDVNNTLMQYFPVAKKQWEIEAIPFDNKTSVLAKLEREELLPEAATDCLLSLLLLEKGNLNEILKTRLFGVLEQHDQ